KFCLLVGPESNSGPLVLPNQRDAEPCLPIDSYAGGDFVARPALPCGRGGGRSPPGQSHRSARLQDRGLPVQGEKPSAGLAAALRRRAEDQRQHGTSLAHQLDAELPPVAARDSPFANALEALGLAAAAAVRRLGPTRSSWETVSGLTSARMLSPAAPIG